MRRRPASSGAGSGIMKRPVTEAQVTSGQRVLICFESSRAIPLASWPPKVSCRGRHCLVWIPTEALEDLSGEALFGEGSASLKVRR